MPVRYTLQLTPRFQRDIDHLPASAQNKVLQDIRLLEQNPLGPHPKVKKLKGQGIGQWRLEVWPYRVRYDVVGRDVVLYRVRHRKDIYRD